ncbi:MAG: dethiobiotin synthase [Acidithiobacillus sp.]
MKQGYFITGTDTGVGKTLISCALLHAFAKSGKSVAGMKPVVAGCEQSQRGLIYGDVEALLAASTVAVPRNFANPYALMEPIAPHIAAQRAGTRLDLAQMASAYRELQQSAELVIVEGAGGFKVPLTDEEDTADLAQRLGLPIIMVVGMRLGCLNHALLTAQAIQSKGLQLVGWVANRIDPAMAVFDENVLALEKRLPAPLLGIVPHCPSPDARMIASLLRISLLPDPVFSGTSQVVNIETFATGGWVDS